MGIGTWVVVVLTLIVIWAYLNISKAKARTRRAVIAASALTSPEEATKEAYQCISFIKGAAMHSMPKEQWHEHLELAVACLDRAAELQNQPNGPACRMQYRAAIVQKLQSLA